MKIEKYEELPQPLMYQSDLEKSIGKCACSFLLGVIVCFGVLVNMEVL